MLKKAEKPDFMNTRAIRVCPKVTDLSNPTWKKPCFYGISKKIVYGMVFS